MREVYARSGFAAALRFEPPQATATLCCFIIVRAVDFYYGALVF